MNEILVITYYWPPAGGPGIQRILKFVKYLPDFGWQPVVLTVKNGDFPAIDNSLENDIPDSIPVYKVPAIEPYSIYRKITGKNKKEALPVALLADKTDEKFTEKFAKWIRANLFIPDARIGWIRPVIRKTKHIIKEHNIKAILSSSPPHSLQLAAKKIASLNNLPWIADLRDPWTEIFYYQNINRSNITKWLDKKNELSVLNSASCVTTVSPLIARKFQETAPEINCKVIFNGYDKSDFDFEGNKDNSFFSIGYIGNLMDTQNCKALWQALREIIDEDKNFADKFRLNLIGKIHPDVQQTLQEYQLREYMKIENYVPHDIAVKRMKENSILLFIIPETPDNKGILTGKIFEYLAAERPLLSIGPGDGDAAKILQDTQAGAISDYNNKNQIKENIKKLFNNWTENKLDSLGPKPLEINKFDRKNLTAKLADYLNTLINK